MNKDTTMILTHHCLECCAVGDVVVETEVRRVVCPFCGIVNDFWLEGEDPPPVHKE